VDRYGRGLLPLILWLVALVAVANSPAVGQPVGQEAVPAAGGSSVAAAQISTGALEGNLEADAYILGPGDVLEIGFWGEVNRSSLVTINPDGDALVPPAGPLRLSGMTLAQARDLVGRTMLTYYRPEILSVSLVSLRKFQVHVVGLVENPGAFEANGVTRVSQAVALAGGPADLASLRNITVRRGSGALRVDLVRYLLLGDNAANPFLNDGDVVHVPRRAETIGVYGAVSREGEYEYVEGETIAGAIDLAGGFAPEARRDSLELERFRTDDPSSSERTFLAADPSRLAEAALKSGDRIFIRAVPDWHRTATVRVTGEVKYPGAYAVEEGIETLSDVVRRAGGLTDKASLAEARLIRGSAAAATHPLEAEFEALKESQEAFTPGEYDLIKTLSRETKGMVSADFEEVLLWGEKGRDPLLYDRDVIEIPRASLAVRVAGQVVNPGLVPFEAGANWRYYVKQAGGFAPGADGGGARLVAGPSGQITTMGGMQIKPGDIIWVPRKKEFSWWSALKDVVSILAQLATIYVVADQVASPN
jgi:polysaccharide export outer membrane protein